MDLQNKNSSSPTSVSKNSSPMSLFLRHGKDPALSEIADYTFTDVIFADGSQLKDVTFEQLSDAVWTLVNKN